MVVGVNTPAAFYFVPNRKFSISVYGISKTIEGMVDLLTNQQKPGLFAGI